MKKRICAIMLSIMMMIMIVPTVFAADNAVTVKVTPDKKEAKPGDIITYTVSVNAPSVYSLQITLGDMTGLEYVEKSGKVSDTVATDLWYDLAVGEGVGWTEGQKMFNGMGAFSNKLTKDVVIGTFQCKVLDNFSGDASVKLSECEITDDNYDAYLPSIKEEVIKVAESKPDPVESKPDPVESKPDPVESKPDDSKPVESKPDDSKPDDSKPVESKPDDSKVEESKPDESKPADSSAAATSSTKPATNSSKAAANNSTKNPNTGSAAPVAMAAIALVGAAAIVVKKKKD